MNLTLGIDLDNVIADTDLQFRKFAAEYCGLDDLPPIPDNYDYRKATGWEFLKDWDKFHRAFTIDRRYNDIKAIPLASEYLEDLVNDGHRIHIITARPVTVIKSTIDWLHEWWIPFNDVTFTADKSVMRPDIHLDDHHDHVSSLLAKGVPALLFRRNWNKTSSHVSVDSWEQFVSAVKSAPSGSLA